MLLTVKLFSLPISNLFISNIFLYQTNTLVPSHKISLYLKLFTVKTTRIIQIYIKIPESQKHFAFQVKSKIVKIQTKRNDKELTNDDLNLEEG